MNDGQQPQDPLPVEKPATTEDFAAYDALVELAGPDSPPGAESFPLGSTRRLGVRLRAATFFGVFLALTLIAVVILLFVGFATDRSGSEPDAPGAAPPPTVPAAQPVPATDAAQPAPTAAVVPSRAPAVPDTWRFTGEYRVDVTITLLPEGDGYGRIAVKGEPRAKGSYTWNDSTLKIAYKQPVTLLTGNVADTKGRFTCKGQPTSAKLRCTIRALAWTSTSTSQNSQWLRLTATGRPLE